MDFGAELDGSEDFFQMFWPTIISHKIGGNVLENVCVSFYVKKILNLVDKVLIVPSQTKSRPCMKSPRETSQQRCNSKSFLLWRASPQRQATPSRCVMQPKRPSRDQDLPRWGRPTFPTRSCGVTVLSTPVLPTTRRPPSMLSPSTTSTGLLQTTWHQGDLFHVSPSPCKEKSIYVLGRSIAHKTDQIFEFSV